MPALETEEQINQFMILKRKSDTELRAICEGMEMSVDGPKEELIERIISQNIEPQHDPLLPQAIPLRSINDQGEKIEAAVKLYKTWRALLFNKGKEKEFWLVDSHGRQYSQKLVSAALNSRSLEFILTHKWYDPSYASQRTLIDYLNQSPSDFITHVMLRKNKAGKSFLMLHVELKKAA